MNWADYLLGVSQNIVAGGIALGGGWFAHHRWVRPVLYDVGKLLEQIGEDPHAQEVGGEAQGRSPQTRPQ